MAPASTAEATGMIQTMQISIMSGEKEHPFTQQQLHRMRSTISQHCGGNHDISEGQPFYLRLISSLAHAAGDPDWEYPLRLQEGVPLGVEEPTWTSPGIWPTKQELSESKLRKATQLCECYQQRYAAACSELKRSVHNLNHPQWDNHSCQRAHTA